MPPKKVSHGGDNEEKREMTKNRKRLQQIKESAKVRSPSQMNVLKSLEPLPQTPQTASKQRQNQSPVFSMPRQQSTNSVPVTGTSIIDLERDFHHVR